MRTVYVFYYLRSRDRMSSHLLISSPKMFSTATTKQAQIWQSETQCRSSTWVSWIPFLEPSSSPLRICFSKCLELGAGLALKLTYSHVLFPYSHRLPCGSALLGQTHALGSFLLNFERTNQIHLKANVNLSIITIRSICVLQSN